jgi:trehalose 6-phosphate synthase
MPRTEIIVTNRPLVELTESGLIRLSQAGGVATAMARAWQDQDAVAVAMAATPSQLRLASIARREGGRLQPEGCRRPLRARFVEPPSEAYGWLDLFNRSLWWALQPIPGRKDGALSNPHLLRKAWVRGYRRINRLFADVVIQEVLAGPGPHAIMEEDFPLYLVPRMVREGLEDRFAIVQQGFTHVPWPHWWELEILPSDIRIAMLRGMLGADTHGFNVAQWVRHFLDTVERDLGSFGYQVDRTRRLIWSPDRRGGHTVAIRDYPVGVDGQRFDKRLRDPAVAQRVSALRAGLQPGARMVALIGRIDPVKGFADVLRAYGVLLRDDASVARRAPMYGFLQPTTGDGREQVAGAEYTHERDAILLQCHRINEWCRGRRLPEPVSIVEGTDEVELVARMAAADVLVVPSRWDGMNLIALETAFCNRAGGLIVLSRGAGAHTVLNPQGQAPGAVTLDPADPYSMKDALVAALAMPPAGRRAMAVRARARVPDLTTWMERRIGDLTVPDVNS